MMTRDEMLDHDPSLYAEEMEARLRSAKSWHPNDPDAPPGEPNLRDDLLAAMSVAMNNVNDLDIPLERFAEAAVEVLVTRNIMKLPDPHDDFDRVDLMDEFTDAMQSAGMGSGWGNSTWHPYANAILDVIAGYELFIVPMPVKEI